LLSHNVADELMSKMAPDPSRFGKASVKALGRLPGIVEFTLLTTKSSFSQPGQRRSGDPWGVG